MWLIEWHPIPASRDRTLGYRIGEGQSGAISQATPDVSNLLRARLAALNKCLAQSNKSCTGGEATKGVKCRADLQVNPGCGSLRGDDQC
jgi:hypothetical protein